MATLYFYGLDDTTRRSWQVASYWKTSNSPSGTASATIPASGDDVVIRRRVSTVPATLNLNSITIDVPSNKTTPLSSDLYTPVADFRNCTSLTVTNGINIIYNNNMLNASSQNPASMFGAASTGTYNTTFNLNFNGGFFSNDNGTINVPSLSYDNAGSLLWNGNISMTGVLASGSYMPEYQGQFIHNSGDLTLQNINTRFVLGSLTTRRTSSSNYTLNLSGCKLLDFDFTDMYGGVSLRNPVTKRLQCSTATFNDCRSWDNVANSTYYFGSGVQSIVVDGAPSPGDNKIWPGSSNLYVPINTSGSTNINLTNSPNAYLTQSIASTGNITLVNSTLKEPSELKGINSYVYFDGTSTIDYSTNLIPISGYTIVSQYPNRYPILASGNYTLSYSGYPSSRNLYFNNAVDTNILTSGNWWNDSSYTSAASEPGLPSDNVIFSGTISATNVYTLNYNSLALYDSSISTVSSGVINSVQNIYLNGSSIIEGANWVRVGSGIVLNNTSILNGNNLGTLGIFGSGTFNTNDDSKFIGDTNKIFLTTSWNGYDGWNNDDNVYYIGGRPTALDSSGNGWDSNSNTYYISGVATSLDSNGSGFYDGHAYYYGSSQPTGWNDYYYYIDDVETTLNNNGSGFWDGHAYYYGSLQPTGWNDYYYYIDDVETTLNNNGSGFYDGHAYYYGSLQPTGWNDYAYYIDDVETTLDSNGDGSWDGYNWLGGVRQVVGSVFVGTDGDWDNLANWIDTNGYAATELPNSGTDITVTTSITTIATPNPTVNSLVVENTAIISIDITVTTSSTFNDSSSYSGAYHLYSDTVIFNDSSSAGGNTHPTTSITFNNNSSASGLALDPLRVYLESGYLNITGFPINPTSLNISNDTTNSTNSTSFSRAGLGVNGSNILGLI